MPFLVFIISLLYSMFLFESRRNIKKNYSEGCVLFSLKASTAHAKDRYDECGIHLRHLLGTLDAAALHPPLHHQHKAARDVMDQKVIGQGMLTQESVPARGQCLAELLAEISKEEIPALTGQETADVLLLVLHVVEHV